MADRKWYRGQPFHLIPSGSVTEASKWLPYAMSRLEAMVNGMATIHGAVGSRLRRIYRPAADVTITIESLYGIPRITIEAGLLVISVGFDNEVLTIKAASDYDQSFLPRLKITPELDAPPANESGLGNFINMGDGKAFFVFGKPNNKAYGYAITLADTVSAKPILSLDHVKLNDSAVAYLGKFLDVDDITTKRLMHVYYEDSLPRKPRISLFTVDSIVVGDIQFPMPGGITYGTKDVNIIYPIAAMGLSTAIMLCAFGTSPTREFYRAQTFDGGLTWAYLPKGPLEWLLEDTIQPIETLPNMVHMIALPNGGAIVTCRLNLPPPPGAHWEPPLPLESSVVALISTDRGVTFADPVFVQGSSNSLILLDPVAFGIDPDTNMAVVGLLTVDENNDLRVSRSDDGGATWTAYAPIAPGIAVYLPTVLPVGVFTTGNIVLLTPSILGIGVFDQIETTHYLYVSKDKGETWVKGQKLGDAAVSRATYNVLRTGNVSSGIPANPAIPDLYDIPPTP